jgi:hypothetical protein
MGRQHQRRRTMGENQHCQKETVVHWERLFRKITQLLQHGWSAAELNIHFEDTVSTHTHTHTHTKKTCYMSFANPTSTTGPKVILRRVKGCHDRKTWTWDNWKRALGVVRWAVLHAVPYIMKIYIWITPKEVYIPKCIIPTGSTWTGWVISCIPWSRCYFRTLKQFSKTTIPPSHSWKCLVMAWRAWRWTSTSSLVGTSTRFEHHHSGQFWRLEWRTAFLKQLEDVLQEELYKIPLETVQALAPVHSNKECDCTEGKRWWNTVLTL